MQSSTLYKNKKPLIVYLIPAFVFMIVFLYYPFIRNIFNSFMKIQGLGTAATGLNEPWYTNYVRLFKDPLIKVALKNTFAMMALTIVVQLGIALFLALLVDNISRGGQFFRTVYFFPIVISATALGLLFNLIFLYDGGLVNNLLLKLGSETLTDWKDEAHFFFTMSLPVMWQYVGFYFVIITTGLNSIDRELYEAARIDGANDWQQVLHLKLPLLRNVLISCLILAITGALKVFDLPFTMFPSGMPMDKSWLTGTYMYHQTFVMSDVDYGSTIAILIVVLGVVVSQIANRVFKQESWE